MIPATEQGLILHPPTSTNIMTTNSPTCSPRLHSFHSSAKPLVTELTNGAILVALQRPEDEEAQHRAQIAIRLYHGLCSSCPTLPLRKWCADDAVLRTPTRKAVYSLPTEIYVEIIRHVAHCHERGDKTLQSLACTSKLFKQIAEEHIYRLLTSKGLFGHLQKSFVFRFSITIEPRRASLVRSLFIQWTDRSEDHIELINIVRECPNLHRLSLIWTPGCRYAAMSALNIDEHRNDMKALLESCPNVRAFKLINPFWEESPLLILDTHFAQFFEQLTKLDTNALYTSPALSGSFLNLTHLVVRERFAYDDNSLSRICGSFPRLQTLDLGTVTINFASLKRACIGWRSTLRHLRFCTIDTQPENGIGELLTSLPALEVLWVLSQTPTTREVIENITKASKLKSLRLRNICLKSLVRQTMLKAISPMLEPIDQALKEMIDTLHPTLEFLYLEDHQPVKLEFIGDLEKAKNFRRFRFNLQDDVEEEDLKGLKEKCPKLQAIRSFKRNNRTTTYPWLLSGKQITISDWKRGWSGHWVHSEETW